MTLEGWAVGQERHILAGVISSGISWVIAMIANHPPSWLPGFLAGEHQIPANNPDNQQDCGGGHKLHQNPLGW